MTRTRAVTIARHTMATRYVENRENRENGLLRFLGSGAEPVPIGMQAIGHFERFECAKCISMCSVQIGDPSGFRRSQPDDIRFPWNSADAAAALSQVRHQFVGIGRYNHG